MGWFKTQDGRLVHGVGELAAVYASRGYKSVTDKQAEQQIAKQQERAARGAKASKAADERDRAAEKKQADAARRERAKKLAGDIGLSASGSRRKPSKAEQKRVEQAIADEAPKG